MEDYAINILWFDGNRVELVVEDMNEGKDYKVVLTGQELIKLINKKDIDAILIRCS